MNKTSYIQLCVTCGEHCYWEAKHSPYLKEIGRAEVSVTGQGKNARSKYS